MTNELADLYFGPTHQPCGFTSSAVAQFDGSAGPVVRELIQNCLDAARNAERPAEVRFVIADVARDAIPGWDSYQRAFENAKKARQRWHREKKGTPSHDERMVIERIESMSSQRLIPVLFCIDNGHGLNGHRMDALLTPGNTSKGSDGAGSFGLGHHAAFGASDLRYVLYAANYVNGSRGELASIASGHTILASHRDPQETLRAADGYWFSNGKGESAFNGTFECYPSDPPELLADYLQECETGSVVCVVGFNDFQRDHRDPEPVDWIGQVAAANFSAAICNKEMQVRIEDMRSGPARKCRELVVRKESLRNILEPLAQQRRAQRGQIRGELAYNAWRTAAEGRLVDLSNYGSFAGVQLRLRLLSSEERADTRVHVFRRGMWIASDVQGLQRRDFSRCLPFDATLLLDSGKLASLVHDAEGPEHRGVDHRRLDKQQRKRLSELTNEIVRCLKDEVGVLDDVAEFVPSGFATVSGNLVRQAEKSPKIRPPSGGGSRKEPRVGGGEKDKDSPQKKPRQQGRPRPGTVPRYRSSIRVPSGSTTVEVLMELDDKDVASGSIGIRLRMASGSDGTCEQPLPDSFIKMAKVEDQGDTARRAKSDAGGLEFLLPAAPGQQLLTITTAAPISNPELLEFDVVKRRDVEGQEAERE